MHWSNKITQLQFDKMNEKMKVVKALTITELIHHPYNTSRNVSSGKSTVGGFVFFCPLTLSHTVLSQDE